MNGAISRAADLLVALDEELDVAGQARRSACFRARIASMRETMLPLSSEMPRP